MSSPRNRHRRPLGFSALVRGVSIAVAAVAFAGLVVISPATSTEAGAATPGAPLPLIVAWKTEDSATTAEFQPKRVDTSPHYKEFAQLSLTVSQTTGLTDQAIRVSVSGFAGTRASTDSGNPVQNAMNYLQAMQCWGPDPLAANFRETCQWGGRNVDPNGLGRSVVEDNTLRGAARDLDRFTPGVVDVPFRTVQGRVVPGKQVLVDPDGPGPKPAVATYPILDYFNPATTNEITSARVNADGTGFFDFETQTADQAPQLGCGAKGGLRCWLVVVPRGTVFGGAGEACSGVLDPANNYQYYTAGRPNSLQGGSPLNPGCDYWENRVVVPLDFSPVATACEIGSAEQRVIGSQLMVGAMSSWQPALCQQLKTTFNFATNPDAIARRQLVEGRATLAFSGFPLSPGEFETNDERQKLAETTLSYAPVAVSGVVVAFLAEFNVGLQTELNLSPRLVAKLLTQSYRFTVPSHSSDAPEKSYAHLPAQNLTYRFLNSDPEFQALNPKTYQLFSDNPSIILPGPAGADAIRQVWRWILADRDAVNFLNGQPDPSGMSVNPYYLPKGNPAAKVPVFTEAGAFATVDGTAAGERIYRPVGLAAIDGSPLRLSEATLDTFMKSDESLAPRTKTDQKYRFDSLQFAPYTDNLLSGARSAFRADPGAKTIWNPTKLNAAGEAGDWVSSGPQVPGQKFTIAITDSPSAARYGLNTAALAVPNTTSFVGATTKGFSAALSALTPTTQQKVSQIDPAKVSPDGYPLTTVTYAAVNLTATTVASRKIIGDMLAQVTSSGQIAGPAAGQLPAGYLPITTAMVAQASDSIAEIRAYVPPSAAAATSQPAQDTFQPPPAVGGSNGDGGVGGAPVIDAAPTTPTTSAGVAPSADERTKAAAMEPIARTGLALSLGLGVGGAIFGPILFKGRGFL